MRPHPFRITASLLATMALVTSCGGSASKSSSDTTRAATTVAPATTTKPTCTSSVPYRAGEGGYASYRIPAVITTESGTLLAFAEGRRDGTADAGDIDTLVRRSTDGGCTWAPVRVVTATKGMNRNNPAPVFDPTTKQVILLTLGHPDDVNETQIRAGSVPADQSMRVYQQTSSDDGVTFSDPVEITAQIKKDDWRWYAVGPGHGMVLTRGAHKGRIVFGANHSVAPPAGSEANPMADSGLAAHAIYSDDHGKTWHIGFVQDNTDGAINGNETTAAELPDGKVYFNTRDQNGTSKGNRADAFSADGGQSLTAPFAPQPSLDVVPVIEASVLQLTGKVKAPLLFSAPSNPNARKTMTIFASTDIGKTFTVAKKISDDPAAYSDLVQLDDATIGLFFETGTKTENDTITFLRIPIRDLTSSPTTGTTPPDTTGSTPTESTPSNANTDPQSGWPEGVAFPDGLTVTDSSVSVNGAATITASCRGKGSTNLEALTTVLNNAGYKTKWLFASNNDREAPATVEGTSKGVKVRATIHSNPDETCRQVVIVVTG